MEIKEEKKETIHPGITYSHYTTGTPLSYHVVKANHKLCRIEPAKAENNGIGRECLLTIAQRTGALTALSGGYFTIGGSFDGKSYGFMKIRDRIFSAPNHETNSLAWNASDNKAEVARLGMVWSLKIAEKAFPLDGFNVPLLPKQAVLYSWALHRSTLSKRGTVEIVFDEKKIISVHRPGGDIEIPKGCWVYSISSDHYESTSIFEPGMPVEISYRFIFLNEEYKDIEKSKDYHEFWHKCDFAISGGPVLIQDGIETTNFDHEYIKQFILFSPQPRSAFGVTDDGDWVLIVVEGRQIQRSIGVSVQELGRLLKNLGCKHALNLDGGASVLMVVEDKIVNTPMFNGIEGDNELGQRRIADAIVILPK